MYFILALASFAGHPGPGDPGAWRGLASAIASPALNRCVPDVDRALAALNARGTARGFHYAGLPALDGLFRHFQGISRLAREDGTWLAVSRSGSPRAVALVGPDGVMAEIPAPAGITHAGGVQALGSLLIVPYEHKKGQSRVVLYDVADPARPRVLYELDRSDVPPPSSPGHASAAALGRLADGRLLLIVGVRSSEVLDVYLSNGPDPGSAGFRFERVTTLKGAVEGRFQSQNLVTQCDGTLFLVGAYNSGLPGPLGSDMLGWYRLTAPHGALQLEPAGKRKVDCAHCNFGAAAGLFVAPDGELLLYGIEHRDSGPGRTVRYEEFRARTTHPTVPAGD